MSAGEQQVTPGHVAPIFSVAFKQSPRPNTCWVFILSCHLSGYGHFVIFSVVVLIDA